MTVEGKKKILYVDDEFINLELFQITFQSEYVILTAESGMEGLEILDREPDIHLVISDMKMPIMDGLTFIEKLKEKYNHIPCIILSGYEQTDAIKEAITKGTIVEYIMKPFNKIHLKSIITRIVN